MDIDLIIIFVVNKLRWKRWGRGWFDVLTVKFPHTCAKNMDVSRDRSIIIQSMEQDVANPLITPRGVVEKHLWQNFKKIRSATFRLRWILCVQSSGWKNQNFQKIQTICSSTGVSSLSITNNLIVDIFVLERIGDCIEEGYFRDDLSLATRSRFTRHLIFATDQQFKLLRSAKRWYGDGTFLFAHLRFISVWHIRLYPTQNTTYSNHLFVVSINYGAHVRKELRGLRVNFLLFPKGV